MIISTTHLEVATDARAWLARSLGVAPPQFHLVRLKGSTSSSMFLVQCSSDITPGQFVLRVLDNPTWLAEEPDLAAHEAAALTEAQTAGLRAPEVVAYASADVGFGAPVVLMTIIEGAVELHPPDFSVWVTGLAEELAAIHRHTAPDFGWRYRSWVNPVALTPPAWTTRPHLWERAIERLRRGPPAFRPVFIHRDYHPTNVLWQGVTLSGVVDWINACQGPAGVDVAHCRSNLLQMFGLALADQFLASYSEAAGGFDYDPYWDIDSLLDTSLPEPTFYSPWRDFGLGPISAEKLCRRVDAYLESVVDRL